MTANPFLWNRDNIILTELPLESLPILHKDLAKEQRRYRKDKLNYLIYYFVLFSGFSLLILWETQICCAKMKQE